MKNYSSLERVFARKIGRFPRLKSILKRAYQYINYVFHKPAYRVKSDYSIREVSAGIDRPTFFGYYDKSPISEDKKYVLTHAFQGNTTRRPTAGEQVDIMAVDRKSGRPMQVSTSNAFNWQQGARLQWVDSSRYAYNDLADDDSSYVTRLVSVEGGKERTYDAPIQDGWKDEYFLSLNYRRLRAVRPDYGYFSLPPSTDEELQRLQDDGLWSVSYKTGEKTLIYSLEEICALDPDASFQGATHYVNHAMISSNGEQFVFLHRYLHNGQRFDRLLLGDPAGNKLHVLGDHDMVSHYCWVDAETILGYMRGPNGHDGYYRVDVQTRHMTPAFSGSLDGYGDGHPHVQGERLVTDTYPDKGRTQRLLLCNLKSGSIQEIAALHHGLQYDAEARCDLHPRLSPDGETVFFDSVFDGTRKQYELRLPEAHEE